MKDKRYIKSFNEATENLNISDVSDSIFNREREIDKLKKELSELIISNKHLSKREIGESGIKEQVYKLKLQIQKLENRNNAEKIRLELLKKYYH
jgi:hypothetical protein